MVNSNIWKTINILGVGLIFTIAYFMIYQQAIGEMLSDTKAHMNFVDPYFDGTLYVPHPIWHIGTYLFSHLFQVDYIKGASFFTAFLITAYAIIIYKIAQNINQYNENSIELFFITFFSLVIGPFFMMSFSHYIYIGHGSPSIWHSVTILAVQPFALLSVFFTIKFFETNRSIYFVLAAFTSTISIFAKPSYIMMYLPALAVYMLLKRYFDKRQLAFALITVLFSVAILAYQFMHEFKGDEGSVIFDFLGVWSAFSQNIPISILLALGLPMLITLSNYKSVKKNEYIKFSWLLVLFGIILFACFAQEGKHYRDGNFSWSWNLSLSLIYIFTLIEYFKQFANMRPVVKYSLLAIILYQVYVGLYFLVGMFYGVSYNANITAFPFF